jgi:hypothetical protein
MANLNLPFDGEVTADNKGAFVIRNKGVKGTGISGQSDKWVGVHGISKTNHSALWGEANGEGGFGVWGETTHDKGGTGVVGVSKNWIGVYGESTGKGHGVWGRTTADDGGAGVIGTSKNWIGVYGESNTSTGVYGKSNSWIGVQGESETTYGVYGHSNGFDGIKGETHGVLAAGVAGYNWTNKGFGIWGSGGEWAGAFQGNVLVTGDISLSNADCAEEFDILEDNVEAGTVMVLNESGSLQPSHREYDKKVAGIVSGASGYKPAIVLDRHKSEDQNQKNANKDRMPIALMGKVYCKVDAQRSSIEIGDLLTTSSTKGYAMKADDPMKAFGAVIGKALGSIKEGLGMIPILVSLQ